MNNALVAQFKNFLKSTFFISLLFSVTIFAFLRSMVWPIPVSISEDGMVFIKTILTGWVLVMAAKAGFEALVFIVEYAMTVIKKSVSKIKVSKIKYTAEIFTAELKYAGE